jgi:hypothetical protein
MIQLPFRQQKWAYKLGWLDCGALPEQEVMDMMQQHRRLHPYILEFCVQGGGKSCVVSHGYQLLPKDLCKKKVLVWKTKGDEIGIHLEKPPIVILHKPSIHHDFKLTRFQWWAS